MIDLNNELGVELTRPGLLQLVPQGQVTCHLNDHMMCQTAESDFGNKGGQDNDPTPWDGR